MGRLASPQDAPLGDSEVRRDRDQVVLEGKQHQLGIALQIERLHDVVLVEFDSLLAQVQLIGDLLDGIALREQLDNIALPGR